MIDAKFLISIAQTVLLMMKAEFTEFQFIHFNFGKSMNLK